jgi:hypothetical protein
MTPDWFSRPEAAAALGIGVPRFLQLRREHHGLGIYFDEATGAERYPRDVVLDLVDRRRGAHDPDLVTRAEAAAILGVGVERFRQIARQHPTRFGRVAGSSARNRALFSRRALNERVSSS